MSNGNGMFYKWAQRDTRPGSGRVTTWMPDDFYLPGDVVKPSDENGLLYRALVDGRSSDTEPTWPERLNGTIREKGGMLWMAIADFTVWLEVGKHNFRKVITIASGAGLLKAGAVLAQHNTTHKWTWVYAGLDNGLSTARAILSHTVDATDSEQQAIAQFIGSYKADKIVFNSAVSTRLKANALNDLLMRGIIVDDDSLFVRGNQTTSTTSTTTSTTL
jgi:hypothetical protein